MSWNSYPALADILGAGLNGIVESIEELTFQDCSGPSAASFGEQGRANLGIKERFPRHEISCLLTLTVLNQQLTNGLDPEKALQLLIENYQLDAMRTYHVLPMSWNKDIICAYERLFEDRN